MISVEVKVIKTVQRCRDRVLPCKSTCGDCEKRERSYAIDEDLVRGDGQTAGRVQADRRLWKGREREGWYIVMGPLPKHNSPYSLSLFLRPIWTQGVS